MGPPHATSIDDLLVHAGWVRRLARRMVADPQAADDLEQEAWVAALEHPPADARNPRGWLARVLRNAARQRGRGEKRRRVRELRVPAREAAAPAGELVERLAAHQRLVQAVWDLEEPYRGTVLLRFFEELSLKDVAKRQGVPVSTVGTRLARGVEKLRERMDRESGGDRRAWSLALAPLAASTATTAPLSTSTIGTLLMQAKLKLAVAAAAVVATGTAFAVWTHEAEPDPRGDVARAAPGGGAATTPQAEVAAPEEARRDRRGTPAAAPAANEPGNANIDAVAPLAPDLGLVAGRALDTDGAGVAGLAVHEMGFAPDDEPLAMTAGDGSFAFDAPGRGLRLVATSAHYATVLASHHAPGTAREKLVVVARRLPLGGVVVGEDGVAAPDATLRFALPERWRSRFTEILDDAAPLERNAAADADGRFRLDALAVDGAFLVAYATGFEPELVPLPVQPTDDLQIVLRRPDLAGAELTGMVLDPLGAPVPGARVGLGWVDSVLTDDTGFFRLDLREDDGAFDLIAVKPGFLPAVMAPPESWPPFVVLELGGAPLTLSGRVVDEDGAPRPGVLVWAKDPTFFGHMEEMSVHAEGLLAELPTRAVFERMRAEDGDPASFDARMQVQPSAFLPRVRTDADGRFELVGMLPREYTLRALDDATLRMTESGPFAAGRSDALLRLPRRGSVGVAGIVVDGAGEPVPGVAVIPRRQPFSAPWGRHGFYSWRVDGESARTDASGRFALAELPVDAEGVVLALESGDVMPRAVDLEEAVRDARANGRTKDELRFVVEVRYHLQVVLGEEHGWVDDVRVLDEEGERMTIRAFGAGGYWTGGSASVTAGRTEVLAVAAGAAQVVLHGGKGEPEAHAVKLERGRLNVIRP